MDILLAVYQLLIGPLELFFEFVFAFAYRATLDPALSILILSLAMNFLVLPLYRRADAMQEEERDRAQAMAPWVNHIKRTFKGDERFMMLQTYYRQCGYKQTDALKGSVSLLLEIPFFIAAYHFLSNLALLDGVQLGPIANLGAPDALISVGGLSINFLPILMTAINVVSAAIYMKGFPLKSKIQMYGIAAIFLVLLYASPAGLVLYWTLNNLFSLVKNIFYKLKNPGLVLSVLFAVVGAAGFIALLVNPLASQDGQVAALVVMVGLEAPLLMRVLRKRVRFPKAREATKEDGRLFLYSCVFLTVVTGVLIPSAVIASSTLEFVDLVDYSSPLLHVLNATLIAAGTFIIWFGVFYRLATPSGKRVLGVAVWIVAVVGAVDYLFFGLGYGDFSPLLQFYGGLTVSVEDGIVNIAVVVLVALALLLLWKKAETVVRVATVSMCIAAIGMSAVNVFMISDDLSSSAGVIEAATSRGEPTLPLSKSAENVVVIMLDRGASCFLPAIFNERPDLRESFDGFTYYPNTVSYGTSTNMGLPGVVGGYEYVPEQMNSRSDESLRDKMNEALRVMPVTFDESGYDVTVFDPTYAGYSTIPDLRIYDDHPDIRTFITMDGSFGVDGFDSASASRQMNEVLKRNFFCYGILKTSPLFLQPTLYNKGKYNSLARGATYASESLSESYGENIEFMTSYAVLDNLENITEVTSEGAGTFLMMCNETPHNNAVITQEPDYVPAWHVDNRGYDRHNTTRRDGKGGTVNLTNMNAMATYHANMAAMLRLGEWLDYLKECGVYDNTRIIMVSDHAWPLRQDKSLVVGVDGGDEWDLTSFNCILLVKDFNGKGFREDGAFMTNADTPTLALAGLIDNPVNPATGNAVENSKKRDPEQLVGGTLHWSITRNNGNTFGKSEWFTVHDDVHDVENWNYLGRY